MRTKLRFDTALLAAVVALVVLLSASGCADRATGLPSGQEMVQSKRPRSNSPVVPAEDLAELVAGNGAFALDLYQALRTRESGNLFYSPYSISLALAMTYAGARGETAAEMAETLHYTLPRERLHPAFNALDAALMAYDAEDEEGFQINVANAIWGQQDYGFLDPFLDTLAVNYGAGLHMVDFVQEVEAARVKINRWVSDETEERIQDLIPQGTLDPLTRLVLTNAIYFNGKWTSPFQKDSTHDATFTLLDGTSVMVPTMTQTESVLYAEGDGYQVAALDYRGADMSMWFVLPEDGGFTRAEAGFTPAFLESVAQGLRPQSVNFSVPKFNFESALRLGEVLVDMGMKRAFHDADFSGMTGDADLFISDVLHKAYVAVDEEGTEAAAATAVIMELSAIMDEPAVVMKLDRPFLFVIRENSSGTILFVGRMLDPR